MDISAKENAKGGHFSYSHKLCVVDGSVHVCIKTMKTLDCFVDNLII